MSNALSDKAEQAVDDDDITDVPGMCQKAQRQVVHQVHGDRFEKYRGDDAKQSAVKWQKSPYVLPKGSTTLPGDIYYWTSWRHGKHGHTAIRVTGNLLFNNTSHRKRPTEGGKCFLPLDFFGKPDLVIRLPAKMA